MSRPAVDQAVAEHPGEHAVDAAVQGRVHGVALAAPVAGGAHGAHLGADAVAALFDEVLDAAAAPLRGRAPGGGSAMPSAWRFLSTRLSVAIAAWSVPGSQSTSVAAHPLPAAEQVLDRQHHRMAGVQGAGGVRRRHRDDEGLPGRPSATLAASATKAPDASQAPVDIGFEPLRLPVFVECHEDSSPPGCVPGRGMITTGLRRGPSGPLGPSTPPAQIR